MSRADKKLEQFLPLIAAGIFVIFFGGLYLSLYSADKEQRTIPTAVKMASVAEQVNVRKYGQDALYRRVTACIKVDASKGARATEIYVGEFEDEDVAKVVLQLRDKGYRAELTSPLSGTNDFLEISW